MFSPRQSPCYTLSAYYLFTSIAIETSSKRSDENRARSKSGIAEISVLLLVPLSSRF